MSALIVRLLLSSCLVLSPLAAYGQAYGFPGKGNPADWSDALPYYNLGNKYLESRHYDQAIESFHAACARYDQDPDFYINLGVAYRKVDDYQSAEQAFTKALSLNDKDWMTWSNLGNALLKQKKLKETIAAFNKSLKCRPPLKEKAAMEKDIVDINKILSMSQPPPPSKSVGTTASRAAALKSSKAAQSGKALANARGQTLSRAANRSGALAAPVQSTMPPVVPPRSAGPPSSEQSGWDDVLK